MDAVLPHSPLGVRMSNRYAMAPEDVPGLIADLRGGRPGKCSFCLQPIGPQDFALPEEGGEWACGDCAERFAREDEEMRDTIEVTKKETP